MVTGVGLLARLLLPRSGMVPWWRFAGVVGAGMLLGSLVNGALDGTEVASTLWFDLFLSPFVAVLILVTWLQLKYVAEHPKVAS